MLDLRITKKELQKQAVKLIALGYCDAQYLFSGLSRSAYVTSKAYGWSCDVYDFGMVTITTGYSPIGVRIDYDIVKQYEDKACSICCNIGLKYEDKQKQLDVLRNEFIQYCKAV